MNLQNATKQRALFKLRLFISAIFLAIFSVHAQITNPYNHAQITYPYDFTYSGNPLVREHGAADPSVHVWGDSIWMYCSQDHSGGYSKMDGYHAFSTVDMINWTDHGDMFNSSMLDESLWGKTPEAWMWAPGAARKKDANGVWTYFLYYPHNTTFDKETWVTGVATAPNPWGPFTDKGPVKGFRAGETADMDPMVFIDDDGQAYAYFNTLKVAKLNPDMISMAESPRSIIYDKNSEITDPDNQSFGEGSYMHKRNGVYYYSYSNFHGDYQGFYAMGSSPYGPFDWQGAMAPNPTGAQDHHSIIDFKNQRYYFYHISLPNIPAIKDGQSRIACYDRLYYNQDGTIQMVVETKGPTKVLVANAANGFISFNPPGGSYANGTQVTLSVSNNLGYAFDSWSGDLSGTNNPATITMDNNKTVTANFISIPTYTLSVSPYKDYIELKPAGGVYNPGTVVTLTAEDFGFNFNEWGGDLTGSANPATITMDSDKNVTVNGVVMPIYTLKTIAKNGEISINPAGGKYEKGTEITLEAIRNFGYKFTEWTGGYTGTDNPTKIVMDTNKTITANFTSTGEGTVAFAANSGGAAFKSSEGVKYSVDRSFTDGLTRTISDTKDITLTTDDILFQSERYGKNFSYNPYLSSGDYEITFMFTETNFNEAGSCLFNVSIEGKEVISNLDVFSKVGKFAAYSETHKVTSTDNNMNIVFTGVKDDAKVSAIKIIKPIPVGINESKKSDTQGMLMQNYPNPFSVKTTIPYHLNEASHVKLSIYNSLGQVVSVLVNEQQAAGLHTVDWYATGTNGSKLTGIYIYQLEVEKHAVQARKLILTK